MCVNNKIYKYFVFKLTNVCNFHTLEVVDRCSETQLQVGENFNRIILRVKGFLTW